MFPGLKHRSKEPVLYKGYRGEDSPYTCQFQAVLADVGLVSLAWKIIWKGLVMVRYTSLVWLPSGQSGWSMAVTLKDVACWQTLLRTVGAAGAWPAGDDGSLAVVLNLMTLEAESWLYQRIFNLLDTSVVFELDLLTSAWHCCEYSPLVYVNLECLQCTPNVLCNLSIYWDNWKVGAELELMANTSIAFALSATFLRGFVLVCICETTFEVDGDFESPNNWSCIVVNPSPGNMKIKNTSSSLSLIWSLGSWAVASQIWVCKLLMRLRKDDMVSTPLYFIVSTYDRGDFNNVVLGEPFNQSLVGFIWVILSTDDRDTGQWDICAEDFKNRSTLGFKHFTFSGLVQFLINWPSY